MTITDDDKNFLHEAIKLAKDAQEKQNFPIGAVITLDNMIIGKGMNLIKIQPNKHAEIEAIEDVHKNFSASWKRSSEMTLYTTLEPCLMCLGTILVHKIGRIIFGSNDPHGGAVHVFRNNPTPYAFKRLWDLTEWIGPALPQECDSLRDWVIEKAGGKATYDKEEILNNESITYLSGWEAISNPQQFKKSLSQRNEKES